MTYKVLARKYRPTTLAGLIGQEVLVRTLTNAILTNRMPHAFVLTGIRGVGKTSTARILARSLLCIGADGNATTPTTDPCGTCANCVAIAEDRHVDVLEMDAASHTGVGDIREIIDNVQYAPVLGRYKVYIIDEVHMLSKNAFNALLKTLEEPPAHTKFIFATTEIRKIPVTILSRCMRFDLARVEQPTLAAHFAEVAAQENILIEDPAIHLIATAAEGSVRDGLSLLDQAIASTPTGETIRAALVQQMLGMADRSQLHALFTHLLAGDAVQAISVVQHLYRHGASPQQVLQELMELCHKATQAKIMGSIAAFATDLDADILNQCQQAATMGTLTRLWQMFLKALQELNIAPDPLAALEMICIRIAYASDMPPPQDLLKKITSENSTSVSVPTPATAPSEPAKEPALLIQKQAPAATVIHDFLSVIDALNQHREALLASWLKEVQLIAIDAASHRLEFVPPPEAPNDFATKLSAALLAITGTRWFVVIAREGGQPSLRKQQADDFAQRKARALSAPLVQQVMTEFDGAHVVDVREHLQETTATNQPITTEYSHQQGA